MPAFPVQQPHASNGKDGVYDVVECIRALQEVIQGDYGGAKGQRRLGREKEEEDSALGGWSQEGVDIRSINAYIGVSCLYISAGVVLLVQIPPSEYWFEVANFVENRAEHEPTKMLSLNSKGPLWTWACTRWRCGEQASTLSGGEAPLCYGGLKWSFSTKNTNDK